MCEIASTYKIQKGEYTRRKFICNSAALGAGRFKPEVAFPYVMKAIRRKDGLCVGVDNPEQLVENARFVRELS